MKTIDSRGMIRHAIDGSDSEKIICGRKTYGHSTRFWSDVNCKNCLKKRRLAVQKILDMAIFKHTNDIN